MQKNNNIALKLLSLITYKKKKQVREFYIPEVNEDGGKTQQKNDNADTRNESNVKSENDKNKGMKKPIPVSEMKKEEQEKKSKADDKTIATDITSNINYIRKMFNFPTNKDIVIREFTINEKYNAFIAYLDGMVDRTTINNSILRPLLQKENLQEIKDVCKMDYLLKNIIEANQVKKMTDPNEAIYEILTGNTLIYVDGCDFYLSGETKGFDKRGVDKPQTEGVVSGSQEAFNETLRTNITLLRKIVKNSNLTTEFLSIGDRNHNLCGIVYINGLVNPAIVDEVKRRLQSLDTDFVLGDGILEQYIEDHPFSLIPTILSTERPDRTASHIMEGKVAIIVEGAPFAKIVPITIHSLFHSPEDSYLRWQQGSFLRLVRIIALFMSTMLPALYIGLVGYHREMIPTDLMISIIRAKENVPFPTVLEILLMEISFELIREAGIRIPGIIGNTIGIIGALILGQAAVQANIVSPVLIIIIAVTGLGNFAIPNFSLAFGIRIARFFFIFAAVLLGFYGITLALIVVAALLMNMKSFGIPFTSIITPKTKRSFDTILRYPVWKQEFRPDPVNPLDVRRQPKISRKWTQEEPKTSYDRQEENDD